MVIEFSPIYFSDDKYFSWVHRHYKRSTKIETHIIQWAKDKIERKEFTTLDEIEQQLNTEIAAYKIIHKNAAELFVKRSRAGQVGFNPPQFFYRLSVQNKAYSSYIFEISEPIP